MKITILVAALGALLQLELSAQLLKPEPTEQDAAMQRHAFDVNLKTWKAKLVSAPERPETRLATDYAKTVLGHPWDFSADAERVRKFGPGLKDVKEGDGRLSFTTSGKGSFFYWGQSAGDPPEFEEKLGLGWPEKNCWEVRVKLRQSLPEAKWEASARTASGGFDKASAVAKGSEWQIVSFAMPATRGERRTSLELACDAPGNNVELAWVEAGTPEARAYFRKELFLDEEPASGKFNIVPFPEGWTLHVNGAKAGDHLSRFKYIDPMDLSKLLKKGRNVLALEIQERRPHGLCEQVAGEGCVRLKSGKIIPQFTDSSWKSSARFEEGWTSESFDDSAWKPAVDGGSVNAAFAAPVESGKGWVNVLDPPYFGPLDVRTPGRAIPAFGETEKVRLEIATPKHPDYAGAVDWKLADSVNGVEIARGSLGDAKESGDDLVREFSCECKRGAYELELRLPNGDSRVFEFVKFGKIPMPAAKEGDMAEWEAKLKLEAAIQCADPASPYPVLDGGKAGDSRLGSSRIARCQTGPVRETGEKIHDWFSCFFQIRNPFKPHLLVVTYPDDAERTFGVSTENRAYWMMANDSVGGKTGWPHVGSGAYSGRPYPLSGGWRTCKTLFFPQTQSQTVTITNLQEGTRAAIGKIEVFEAGSELPAADMTNDAGERLWGVHAERVDLSLVNFNGSPRGGLFINHIHRHAYRGWWRDWFLAIENQIRYMRWSGQNLYFAGVYMYDHAFYPSSFYEPVYGASLPSQDSLELMGRMFNANGLKLILGVEYFDSVQLRALDRFTQKEVDDGAPTIMTVSHDGKQGERTWMGKMKNSFHPEVQKDMLRRIDEIVARYKGVPGIVGVGLITGGAWLPSASLDTMALAPRDVTRFSYDDETVRQFEQDSGLKIPASSSGRERFRERYLWLKSFAWDKWLNWRAQAMTDFKLKLRDSIYYGSNKTLRCYLIDGDFISGSTGGEESFLHGTPLASFDLERGVRPQDLSGQPGLTCIRAVSEQGARQGRIIPPCYASHWSIAKSDKDLPVRAMRSSPGAMALQAGSPTDGVYNFYGFNEPNYKVPSGKDWLWQAINVTCVYPLAPGEHILADYANFMASGTPAEVMHTWCDVELVSGGEEFTRPFIHAFRTLPLANYKKAEGDGIDDSTPFFWSEKNFGYLLNPWPWPVKVKLSLDFSDAFPGSLFGCRTKEGALVDLVSDKTLATSDGEFAFDLKPCQLLTFKCAKDVRLLSLTVEPSEAARKDVETKIAETDERLAKASGASPAKETLARCRDRAKALLEKGLPLQAEKSLEGREVLFAGMELKKLSAEIPCLLYGPFDNAGSSCFLKVCQPEAEVVAGKTPSKSFVQDGKTTSAVPARLSSLDGRAWSIDFKRIYPESDWKCCYVYTKVFSPEKRAVKLSIGSDDGIKIWVGGKLVHENFVSRGAAPGQDFALTTLEKGWNPILFKVENRIGGWALFFEILSASGARLDDLRFSTEE